MPSPFDVTKYRHCCGQSPRFTLAPDAKIWFAKCDKCRATAAAIDGSADGLADAWNEAMERRDDK